MAPDASFFELALKGFLSVVIGAWIAKKLYGPHPDPDAPRDGFRLLSPEFLEQQRQEELAYRRKWEDQIAHSNYRPLTADEWQTAKDEFPHWFKKEPKSLAPPFLDLPRGEYSWE